MRYVNINQLVAAWAKCKAIRVKFPWFSRAVIQYITVSSVLTFQHLRWIIFWLAVFVYNIVLCRVLVYLHTARQHDAQAVVVAVQADRIYHTIFICKLFTWIVADCHRYIWPAFFQFNLSRCFAIVCIVYLPAVIEKFRQSARQRVDNIIQPYLIAEKVVVNSQQSVVYLVSLWIRAVAVVFCNPKRTCRKHRQHQCNCRS